MDNTNSFGPFTPQEFKTASEWLDKNNVEFTFFRDEEAEKRFAENTPENIVNQVELRTKTYLGAVFYIKADMDPAMQAAFKEATHLTPDSIPDKFKVAQIPEETHSETAHNKKAKWARILLIAALVYAIIRVFSK